MKEEDRFWLSRCELGNWFRCDGVCLVQGGELFYISAVGGEFLLLGSHCA
jgi:hypothetical protein